MTDSYATFNGRTNHQLRLFVSIQGQNAGGNYTTFAWQLLLDRSGVGSFTSSPTGSVSVTAYGPAGGQTLLSGAFPAYDTRSATEILLASGTVNIAHDAAGNLTANFYASASGVNLLGAAALGPTYDAAPRIAKVPSAPTGLALTALSGTSIKAAWTAPSDNGGSAVSGYRVQISTSSGFSSTTSVDIGSGTPNYTFTGLTPGTLYYVRVYAQNGVGFSGASASQAINTLSVPSAPTINSVVAGATDSTSTVNFTDGATGGSAITSYTMQAATDSAFTTNLISLSPSSHAQAVTGLLGGQTYYYRVRANNAVGAGAWSPTVSLTQPVGTFGKIRAADNLSFVDSDQRIRSADNTAWLPVTGKIRNSANTAWVDL